ncbi:MAG: hypothetical protein ABI666_00890 [Ferruginibacter sp.]
MQRFLLLFAFLFFAAIVKADCTGNGISCWPNTSTIKANPVFVITFYAYSHGIVAGLNTKNAIYLRSGEEKVRLKVVEVCIGQFRLTQVILKPGSELIPGREYELVIDSLPAYERIQKWNKKTFKSEPPKWKVLNEIDTEFPTWTELPKFKSKSIAYFGCGPSLAVNFGFTAADGSDLLVKTIVKNRKTGKFITYYLESPDNNIAVGHSMCSGAFDFDSDDEYEVSFALMDASGNPGCLTTAAIYFTGPTAENEIR